MNFGKRGVRRKLRELNSISTKMGKKFTLTFINVFILAIVAAIIIGVSAGIGIFKGIIDTAPDISNIDVTPSGFSTFVYDTEGNQTAKLVSTDSNRIPVTMDMIPENLANAFVAIEDERFYEHNGIDIQGIIRAGFVALTSGDLSQGASTITQQLLKNNVFSGWTSETDIEKIKRKIQEQYLALQLEKTMSKEDILLNYMNTINLGSNTLGVQAASLRYFNKSVSTLTLSECAVIAGITQNPSRYNPITHPEDNATRREKVLKNMLKLGYITQTEYDSAIADDVYSRIQIVDSETETDTVNSYFVDALTTEVLDDLIEAGYNETQAYTLLYSGGLKIYSTQDPTIQGIVDEVFQDEANYPENTQYLLDYELTIQSSDETLTNYSDEKLQAYFKENESASFDLLFSSSEEAEEYIEKYKQAIMQSGDEVYGESISLTPQPQVSMTIEDQETGYVVALVGGRGQKTASRTLNRATDTVRQPGSTFKVVSTYAPALDSAGFTLATILNDAPFNYSDGHPVNNWYGEAYRGLTSVRTAIKDSMNVIAVKTMTLITPQLAYDYLLNFGFTTIVDSEEINGKIYSDIQVPTALGGLTHGVKNIELNAAYAAIANGGVYVEPKLYTKVVDHDGNTILDNSTPNSKRILKETTAFLLTSAMEDVVTSGTGTAVNFGTTAIAGKTGTTSDENDVWFAGYTNYYTATTWAGYDNNEDLSSSAETKLAKTMWRTVMEKIHESLPSATFEVPDGIVQATVCSRSGKLPISGLCDGTLITEYFEEGTVPTDSCNVHYSGNICQYDSMPATDCCPFKAAGVYELTPSEPAALQSGSGSSNNSSYSTTTDELGNSSSVINRCHHTTEFMSQANIQEILQQEAAEINARYAAAGIQSNVVPDSSANPAAASTTTDTTTPAATTDANATTSTDTTTATGTTTTTDTTTTTATPETTTPAATTDSAAPAANTDTATTSTDSATPSTDTNQAQGVVETVQE